MCTKGIKTSLASIVLFFIWMSVCISQSIVYQLVMETADTQDNLVSYIPFSKISENAPRASAARSTVPDALLLTINEHVLGEICMIAPKALVVEIPVSYNKSLELLLYREKILSSDFTLRLSSDLQHQYTDFMGYHYRGVINGDANANSVVALSFFSHEIMGVISSSSNNWIVGKLENDEQSRHVVYQAEDLILPYTFECHTPDDGPAYTAEQLQGTSGTRDMGDCVRVYVEVDYDIYLSMASVLGTVNFITAIFNQAIVIYANEGIPMYISEMLVWDTPSPYYINNSLGPFWNDSKQVNGDIRHLIIWGSAGRASSIGGICHPNPNFHKCYSGIYPFYEEFPGYSWSAEVITHEMGHVLGSRHTHACVWNGDSTAIDGCAERTEGDCPVPELPADGGTIMSYCSFFPLSNGFGPQPGNVIRYYVNSSFNCLTSCGLAMPNDAGIYNILHPGGNTCDSVIIPEVVLKNYGTDTLKSVNISYDIDQISTQEYHWEGLLAPQQQDTFLLGLLEIGIGGRTLSVSTGNPNNDQDLFTDNDMYKISITRGSQEVELAILFTVNSQRISWNFKDDLGKVIARGGPYNQLPGTEIIESFCLFPGCLNLEFYNPNGQGLCCVNGQGHYKLTDKVTGEVLLTGGEFSFLENTWLCIDDMSCLIETEFPDTILSHKGHCSTTLTYDFETYSSGSRYLKISNLDYKLNTSSSNRYEDVVTVNYRDINGEQMLIGTFYAIDVSGAQLEIPGNARAASVTIENAWQNEVEVSVSIGFVPYCTAEPQCPDNDGDGICDQDDTCPGEDDGLDYDADEIPDACDNCPFAHNPDQLDSDNDGIGNQCEFTCYEWVTSEFSTSIITHSGMSESKAVIYYDFENEYTDIYFTISELNAILDTIPCYRYIEEVIVQVDSEMFSRHIADSTGTIEVHIPGPVKELEVILTDGYDGELEEGEMHVALSSVQACKNRVSAVSDFPDPNSEHMRIIPNPANALIQVSIPDESRPLNGLIILTIDARIIPCNVTYTEQGVLQIEVSSLASGMYFLKYVNAEGKSYCDKFIISR